MQIEYVALSEVQRWPRNPKLHDIPKIVRSLQRFGFVTPVMLDESTGRVVAGHGRCKALEKLKSSGGDPPARVRTDDTDWLVPVVRGVSFSTESEAEAYLIADNKLSEIGGWDQADLADLLDDLVEQDSELFSVTGWDEAQFRELTASLHDVVDVDMFKEEQPAPSKPGQSVKFGGDGNWFYVEFYGDDAEFNEVARLLGPHLAGKHEIDPRAFKEMVELWVARRDSES